MIEINYHERIIPSNDWVTILFVLSVFIIALNRSVFKVRFFEFSRLAVSDKYVKIYRDTGNMMSGFTVLMFILQLVSYSIFILFYLHHYEKLEINDSVLFIQIFTFLTVFILSKYLIEKIIGVTFEIEEFIEHFNLLKVSYRSFLGFILLPVSIIIFYNNLDSSWLYTLILVIIIFFNIITYIKAIKMYQNIILSKIFYFILYLCTFEIAPYYFLYKWITKN